MPGSDNIYITQHTTKEQLDTFKQEQKNDYFTEFQHFEQQNELLQQNKRTLLGFDKKDSRQMANVKESLSELKAFLSTPMSSDLAAFDTQRRRGYQLYERLSLHCETYINAKGSPITASGKSRLAMVKIIYNQCCEEKKLFNDCAQSLFQEAGNQSILWSNVLGEIRIAHVNIDHMNVYQTGNGSSQVWRFRQGEKAAFFKAEEKVPVFDQNVLLDQYMAEHPQESKASQAACRQIYLAINKRPEMAITRGQFLGPIIMEKEAAQKTFDEIKAVKAADDPEYIAASDRLSTIKKLEDLFEARFDSVSFSPEEENLKEELVAKVMDRFRSKKSFSEPLSDDELACLSNLEYMTFYFQATSFVSKQQALSHNCENAKIKNNAVISTRNVATSRLAALLGFPELIAKSRTIVLEKGGKKIKGNLMMEASGTEFFALTEQAKKNGLTMEYTPEMIRQLTVLQLMDTLCAQYDRNKTNYFVESHVENGRLMVTGLTAIDNDIAFGEVPYEEVKIGGRTLSSCESDKHPGMCSLPAVDQDFFESIMNLDPKFVDYTLGDLLSEPELAALKDRLAGLKELLRATFAANPDFVVDKKHWPEAVSRFAQTKSSYIQSQYVPRRNQDGNSNP